MSVTGTLTKQSIRTLRTGCPTCKAEGPFYLATDESGVEHLIVKNAATKAADQGDTVSPSFVHICVKAFGDPERPGGDAFGGSGSGSEDNGSGDAEAVPAPAPATPAAGAPASDGSEADMLRKLLQQIMGTPQIDADEVRAIAKDVIEGVVMPTRTYVQTPTETREIEGVTHKQFLDVLAAIDAGCNVQLVGAPGVGKTHMCQQVADALGRDFYVIGFHLQSTASELRGYMSANGEFVPTVVYDWASNPEGGILLTDELDRSHPGIQAALNSLLSNRFISLPNRETVYLNDKHVILAATNTYGDGPTWEFPAAQKFSAEFKDRFIAMTIEIDTDIEMAAAMAKGAAKDLTQRAVSYVQKVRANVQREAIAGVTISPRASQNMAALLAKGVDWDKAVAWTLQKGMDKDTWRKVAA
ncbi:AAA-ATPase [Mycobacterium phage Chaser]|nr:AAA-ATPase [Mycobacterium phage Chaser]